MKKLISCFAAICLLVNLFSATLQAAQDEVVIPCENGASFKADDNWRPSGLKGENDTATKYTINNNPTQAIYTANLDDGNYRVFFDNIVRNDNAPKIKIIIGHSDGETELELTHNTGTSGYVDLGVYTMSKDTPATVTVERITEKTMRIASVKFVKTTDEPQSGDVSTHPSQEETPPETTLPQPPATSGKEVIINVGDSGYTESDGWQQSGLAGYNGKPSRYSPESDVDSFASFTALLDGRYRVFFHNIVNQNGHDDPKISVTYSGGETVISYSGKEGATDFIDLGVYEFDSQTPAVVKVMKSGSGCIRASAVKFVPTDEPVEIKTEAVSSSVSAPKVTFTPDAQPAYDGIRVSINGKEQTYDQMPVLMNDRTLVPMRGIFEAMGAKISWDDATQTVTATTAEHEIILTIGNKTAYTDQTAVELDQEPILLNDRTMVPVRFVAESLDAAVEWVDEEQLVKITKDNLKDAYTKIILKDLGAKADGITDDGPVLQQALNMAKESGGYTTLVFEEGKTYYIGARPDSWHYFVLDDFQHIYFDGNGSELIFERTNGMFRIMNSQYITFDALSFDLSMPNYFQGEIISVQPEDYSFIAKKAEGYPEPKTGTESVSAGGGMHGIIYDKETGKKPSPLASSLNPVEVADLGNGEFLFKMDAQNASIKEAYQYVKPGQLYTIGLTGKDVPKEYSEQREYYPMSSFYVERCGEVEWKNTNLYGSMAMGMTLVCNEGNLYFTNHSIRRKPGTDRMLSVPSDGIHARSNRGSLIFDNCYLEASGDDLLSPHHKDEKIVQQISPTEYVLSATAGDFLPTRVGDELMFFNRHTGEIYGLTHVTEVIPDEASKTNKVMIEEIEGLETKTLDPNAVFVMNLDLSAKGTIIRNTTFRPVHRNAILLRLSNILIEGCTFESIGGQLITAIGQSNTGVVNYNQVIRNNRFIQTLGTALRLGTCIFNRHPSGYFQQNLRVENNEFTVSEGYGINITDGNQITLKGNKITILEDTWQLDASKLQDDYAIRISNSFDIICENNEITVNRTENAPSAAIFLENCAEEVTFSGNQFNLPANTQQTASK